MKNRQSERGVALLFALGVLSLMLVTGLAFLGNALISQKIAVNNSEFDFARQLARSAAYRAMSQLAMFNFLQSAYHENMRAYDASHIFSGITLPAAPNSTAVTGKNDGLKTKLLIPDLKEDSTFPGYGQYSKAKWVYVYENGEISDDSSVALTGNPKIIGRYAYQVLPQTSRSRLSLFAVTSGAKGIAGLSSTASSRKIPHKHRWGVDVDELLIPGILDAGDKGLFTELWGQPGTDDNEAPQHELSNFFNLFSTPESPNHLYVSNDTGNKAKNYKNWLRNIFVGGKARMAREAYPDKNAGEANVSWYPRFNLGRFENGENWYERFIKGDESVDDVLNKPLILDRLTRHPGNQATINSILSEGFKYTDGYENDGQYDPFGLPFLRRIGHNDEKGGFTTIEYLRKQIAANLNDYCDADSVPTSNIPAKDWKDVVLKTAESEIPQYTGNEKTPYINEVAFGFCLKDAKFDDTQVGSYLFKAASFEAELLAELISVYKGVAWDSNTKLYSRVKSLSVTFSVSFTADAQGSYNDGDTVKNVSGSVEETKQLKVDFPVDQDIEIMFSGDSLVGSGPYWIGGSKKIKHDGVLSIDFTDKIKSDLGCSDKTLTELTVNLKTASIKIDRVAFNLGHLALTQGEDNVGIDFVKFDSTAEREISFADGAQPVIFEGTSGSNIAAQLADATGGDKGIFYCGGMQVFDPRQNLNANKTADRKNDWYLTEGEATFKLNTANRDNWKWELNNNGKLSDRISGGAVNTHSNPKTASGVLAAGSGSAAAQPRDIEAAEDPAWQGDDDGEHISTAVIRNAPMRSPWELGFIHRGIPFQTINLKGAGSIDGSENLDPEDHVADEFATWNIADGTKYEHGDAGILDQIKMTDKNKSFGKVDLESLSVSSPWWMVGEDAATDIGSWNLAVFKSLFNNIRQQTAQEFLEESIEDNSVLMDDGQPALKGTPISASVLNALTLPVLGGLNGSGLRSKVLNENGAIWKVEPDDPANPGKTNDAKLEELVGKTFNLIEVKSFSLPNVYRIVVVAQSIRDLEGGVSRWKLVPGAEPQLRQRTAAQIGVFDADSDVYYDEIMGECRMLLTVEKVDYMESGTPKSRLRVKQIEYLD